MPINNRRAEVITSFFKQALPFWWSLSKINQTYYEESALNFALRSNTGKSIHSQGFNKRSLYSGFTKLSRGKETFGNQSPSVSVTGFEEA